MWLSITDEDFVFEFGFRNGHGNFSLPPALKFLNIN